MNKSNVRNDLKEIFQTAVNSVNPYKLIQEHITLENNIIIIRYQSKLYKINLNDYNRLVVIGSGKATLKMTKALFDNLGNVITDGIISVKAEGSDKNRPLKIGPVKVIYAGHPVPDSNSLKAGEQISKLVENSDEKTLIFNLISGGGSALVVKPFKSIEHKIELDLSDLQQTTKTLLSCGATINEINCLRKHLSGIKGGRLMQLSYPAHSYNFILSDVIGDRLDAISSGMTTFDETTFEQAAEIIAKYEIKKLIPEKVNRIIKLGADGLISETPKKGDKIFDNVKNFLVGTNYQCLLAAKKKAEELGYNSVILTSNMIGEAKEAAKVLLGIGKDVQNRELLVKKPACVIAGGETTVTLKGKGKGGRNQELALSVLNQMDIDPKNTKQIYFLAASTDGNDGPTDAAGAFADKDFLDKSKKLGLSINEYLKRNDSYHFFEQCAGLLKTGLTETNVSDINIMIII